MTTLTMRMIKGHFVVGGPNVEPMKFKTATGQAANARQRARNGQSDRAGAPARGAAELC